MLILLSDDHKADLAFLATVGRDGMRAAAAAARSLRPAPFPIPPSARAAPRLPARTQPRFRALDCS